jgi:hypothetical protein
MNDEALNQSIRRFLKQFGITAQREIERAVAAAVESGTLSGTETLAATATLEVTGLALETVVRGDIALQ